MPVAGAALSQWRDGPAVLPRGAVMTLHAPTHRIGSTSHHYLRYALLAVSGIALALVLWIALILVRPAVEEPATSGASTELINAYRAGERALWALPVAADSERFNEFRAGERDLWVLP